MNRIYLIGFIAAVSILSCKKEQKAAINQTEKKVVTATNEEQAENKSKNTTAAFSWENIPVTTKDIGAYPYITPPKGMVIDENTSDTESYDFHKLEMFDGNSFFDIEGPVEKMGIQMDNDKEWNQYLFDKSVKEYLTAIGAQLVFEGKIPNDLINQKGETVNDRYTYFNNFYVGDIVNSPIRMYVLKTPTKKIGIQVYSDTARGQIGVVESKEFEQTIEKITADKIIDDINTKGFATLHINFDTGKSRIKSESYEIVSEITKMLNANPDLKISIEGHTDNVGSEETNMKLSKNRARSVLMALVDEGVDESRLVSTGFGQSKPIGDNASEEGKALNRRVELRKIE
ncbi:MAG: OmpA family protein [Algicola sp.]|nr:OmpA family protein [Algicola sp.]